MFDDTQPNPRRERDLAERHRRTASRRRPARAEPPIDPAYPEEYPGGVRRARLARIRRPPRRGAILGRYTPRAILIGVLAGATIFALLGAMTVVGAYGYFQVFELILPGVTVGDVALGAMSRPDATRALAEAWGQGRGIILSDGTQNWYASSADFGMTLDPAATAQRAYDVGHGGPILAEFVTLFESALRGTAVAPVVAFDEAAARAGLEAWAPVLYTPPQDASLRIEGGQVIAVPGEPGRSLDVEATLRVLAADPSIAIMDGYLPLVLIPVAPRIADASAAVAEAQPLLDAPLAITAYDPVNDQRLEWTATPETIAAWLTVQAGEDGSSHVVVDPARLGSYLDTLNASLGEGRFLDVESASAELQAALAENRTAALIVRHPPTTYTVQPGDTLTRISWAVGIPYWRILDANPDLEPNAISPGQTLAIPSKDDLLPLPVIPHKRIRVDISDQHLWAYQDGQELYSFVISTGIDRSPTQPGVFQVLSHEPSAYASLWDLTMPHFLAIYESWPGFYNGFHGLPTLSNGTILWREILGRPASYGCIILDLDDGETLYNWAEDGVVVEIVE